MKNLALMFAWVTVAACSSSSAASAPDISNLTIPASIVPGTPATGQVDVSNAAGLSGLSIEVAITSPSGASTRSETTVQGSSSETEGQVDVLFELPLGAPSGTYSLTLTVLDGSDASNALTTRFDIGAASVDSGAAGECSYVQGTGSTQICAFASSTEGGCAAPYTAGSCESAGLYGCCVTGSSGYCFYNSDPVPCSQPGETWVTTAP